MSDDPLPDDALDDEVFATIAQAIGLLLCGAGSGTGEGMAILAQSAASWLAACEVTPECASEMTRMLGVVALEAWRRSQGRRN